MIEWVEEGSSIEPSESSVPESDSIWKVGLGSGTLELELDGCGCVATVLEAAMYSWWALSTLPSARFCPMKTSLAALSVVKRFLFAECMKKCLLKDRSKKNKISLFFLVTVFFF